MNSLKTLLMIVPVTIFSCGNPDRNDRDDGAETVIDSIRDTTARANAITADVDLNGDEKTFILAAATGGMMEVEAATIAIQLSENAAVRRFAEMMLKDHKKANAELEAIASDKGMKLPSMLPDDKEAHLANLKTLNGKQFEEQYMTMMIGDHAKTIKLFSEGAQLKDNALKMFAGRTLAVVTAHYNEAVKIGKTLNLKHSGTGDDLLGESPTH